MSSEGLGGLSDGDVGVVDVWRRSRAQSVVGEGREISREVLPQSDRKLRNNRAFVDRLEVLSIHPTLTLPNYGLRGSTNAVSLSSRTVLVSIEYSLSIENTDGGR